MSVLQTVAGMGTNASSGVDIGDNIANSLMLDSASSQYLSRTAGTPTSNTVWTLSRWIKRGKLGTQQTIISAGVDANNYTECYFDTGNKIVYRVVVANAEVGALQSNEVFRDVGAHFQITLTKSGTTVTVKINSGSAPNGFTVTWTTIAAITSADTYINSAVAHAIGSRSSTIGIGNYGDWYDSNTIFVDGQALATSNFGRTSADTGQWVNKDYTGTYGNNGFKLNFSNSAALGTDSSGNGNNWTLNGGISSANQYTDTPTNNYAVFNKLSTVTTATLTVGNTKTNASTIAIGSIGMSGTMKSYWEVTSTTAATSVGMYGTAATTTTSVAAGKTYGLRFDASAGTFDYINITDAGSWTSLATGLTATPYFQYVSTAASAIATLNSGSKTFAGSVPSSYLALCTANLPTPAVIKSTTGFVASATAESSIYSQVAADVSGWPAYVQVLKNRTTAESWVWTFSHDATNEYAVAASSCVRQAVRVMSGSDNWIGYSLRIGSTYGTAAGSVSHTSGADTTVTHNIGISARQMIFLFLRSGAGTTVPVYHADLTAGKLIDLCTNGAEATLATIKTVTSNSFKIDTGTTTGTYDYLVITEVDGFSAVRKWAGNSSTDGTFAYDGLKARARIQKNISAASVWRTVDTARDTYNVVSKVLNNNNNVSEATAGTEAYYDMNSNGFKLRVAGALGVNTSGETMVYVDFAEAPLKYATGR